VFAEVSDRMLVSYPPYPSPRFTEIWRCMYAYVNDSVGRIRISSSSSGHTTLGDFVMYGQRLHGEELAWLQSAHPESQML
jgi:hypothetical protein